MTEGSKCAVRGCLATATMLLTSTIRPARGFELPAHTAVCAAHASQFRPGTRYSSRNDGSIKLGGFRPNATVESVTPIE